jgi:hypothetical protein
VQHSDNAPYTFALSHLPCIAAVFGHKTHCSLTKLHVTAVCYRDSRTDSIHRFYPIGDIQQEATADPTALTYGISRGSSTNSSTPVTSVYVCVCACACMCVFVCAEGQ